MPKSHILFLIINHVFLNNNMPISVAKCGQYASWQNKSNKNENQEIVHFTHTEKHLRLTDLNQIWKFIHLTEVIISSKFGIE